MEFTELRKLFISLSNKKKIKANVNGWYEFVGKQINDFLYFEREKRKTIFYLLAYTHTHTYSTYIQYRQQKI